MRNTEKHAADIMLDRGVAWWIEAPWWMQCLGKKKIKITLKALRLGTLLELSRLYVSTGINADDIKNNPHMAVNEYLDTICLIVAICVLNSKMKIKLFATPAAKYFRKKFTANMLLEVVMFIVFQRRFITLPPVTTKRYHNFSFL